MSQKGNVIEKKESKEKATVTGGAGSSRMVTRSYAKSSEEQEQKKAQLEAMAKTASSNQQQTAFWTGFENPTAATKEDEVVFGKVKFGVETADGGEVTGLPTNQNAVEDEFLPEDGADGGVTGGSQYALSLGQHSGGSHSSRSSQCSRRSLLLLRKQKLLKELELLKVDEQLEKDLLEAQAIGQDGSGRNLVRRLQEEESQSSHGAPSISGQRSRITSRPRPAKETRTQARDNGHNATAKEASIGSRSSSVNSSNGDELLRQLIARQSVAKELPKFDGNPIHWPRFYALYKRTSDACKFSEEEDMARLDIALTGKARQTVESLLTYPHNLKIVIQKLEHAFGRPSVIIKALIKRVSLLPACKESQPSTIVDLADNVNNLVATMVHVNSEAHLRNPTLLEELGKKLSPTMRYAWSLHQIDSKKEATLLDLASWLERRASAARLLEEESTLVKDKIEEKRSKKHVLNANIKADDVRCFNCSKSHKLTDCEDFKTMTIKERRELIKKLKVCYNCLRGKHMASECKSKRKCTVDNCGRRHHVLLHEGKSLNGDETTTPEEVAPQLTVSKEGVKVLLRVLPVTIMGPKGSVATYALLDEGSALTLVENSLTRELGVRGRREALPLAWTDGEEKTVHAFSVKLKIKGDGEEFHLTNVKALNELNLPAMTASSTELKTKWTHLKDIPVNTVLKGAKPRILIGQDNIHLTMPREIVEGKQNEPVATKTKLGWVIHGRNYGSKGMNSVFFIAAASQSGDHDLHQMVKHYFSLESVGVQANKALISKEDVRALKIAELTTKRIGDRWETGLLWKTDDVTLPESYTSALKRLRSIEKKVKRDPDFASSYGAGMQAYVEKGYARRLTSSEVNTTNHKLWYLPHFGVVNPKKPSKLLIVFDAAARSNGTSLNDNLLSGPDLLSSLVGMLFKFRERRVAFAADIREMFPQIRIRNEDAVAQRYLWRDLDESADVAIYQMDSMVFGATCSPFSAQEVRNKNAREFAEELPRASDAIVRKHYMDDYLDSVDTVEDAIKLVMEVISIHERGGFDLMNWISNSKQLLTQIPESIQSKSLQIKDGSNFPIERVLGMHWDPNDDNFVFVLDLAKFEEMSSITVLTKRKLLSMIMTIFDPLGLLADLLIQARIILQDVWRSKIGWDDEITAHSKERWKTFLNKLTQVKALRIPRWYETATNGSSERELHVFCDASEEAYCAVAYIRSELTSGIKVNIVLSKSRVAPLKPVSIPRMELQAALIGSRIAELISKEHDIKFNRRSFWTDSKTVLSWINSDARKFKQFVANRIGEILELINCSEWHWCPTLLNVADEGTRSNKEWNLSTNRWRYGPDFLHLSNNEWPNEVVNLETSEEKKSPCVLFVNVKEAAGVTPDVGRFSNFLRLLRATARTLQAVQMFKKTIDKNVNTELTMELLTEAERMLLRDSQQRWFHQELRALRNKQLVEKSSPIVTLSPYLDDDGLIRIKGRIDNSSAKQETKRPIILHSKDQLTRLIIDEEHVHHLHICQEAVVNALRQKYWILNMRNAVRSAWARCLKCQNKRAQPKPPLMGQLPTERVNTALKPFQSTGIDYFGPLLVTVKRSREKRYGVLFTCLNTRAIHLELAHSLTTDSCVMAIRRFSARRGQPDDLWSDNGTNLRGADKELREYVNSEFNKDMQDEMLKRGIRWHFIPPAAPHMGGIWERLIRSVKTGLSAILNERAPKEETLLTLLTEVEAVVNSRPLTHVSLDPQDEEPLTPNHFLIGRASALTRYLGPKEADQCLKKQWLLAKKLADEFWRRWIREYLPTLIKRNKWNQESNPVNIGDVCILVDENLPRGMWLKAVITRLHPGKDGQVRVVDIRTKIGELRRPVHKLCVLVPSSGVDDIVSTPRGRMLARES